jgi:hypothetical protein
MDICFINVPYVYVLYKTAWTGGRTYKISRGKWNFYISDLGLKIPYTNGIFPACRSRATPNRKDLVSGKLNHTDFGRYTVDEWVNALFKPIKKRIIENYISSKRLYEAGLGPNVHGICNIKSYMVWGRNWIPNNTYGLIVEDVFKLPPKRNATKEEIRAAGVELDKIESCWRQQVNGYVIDLDSVCGVMPTHAEKEIQALERWLNGKVV